jgi:hypothetical protein
MKGGSIENTMVLYYKGGIGQLTTREGYLVYPGDRVHMRRSHLLSKVMSFFPFNSLQKRMIWYDF